MRNLTMWLMFASALTLSTTGVSLAAIETKTVEYKEGDTVLEGFMAWDDQQVPDGADAPGVLIVHQWMGLTDYEKYRAKRLAADGYVVFALDIYGKGVRPANRTESAKMSSKYKGDRALFRKRLNAGLKQLTEHPAVDKKRVAAIGYCFGGTGVLELARSGADVAGVVSFHGGLDSPSPEDGRNIKCRVLVCHGADDPFVKQEGIDAMVREFNAAKVDWQMINYSGAVHSFTQPMAGNDPSRGAAYNAKADRRSWTHMKVFFGELFD